MKKPYSYAITNQLTNKYKILFEQDVIFEIHTFQIEIVIELMNRAYNAGYTFGYSEGNAYGYERALKHGS